MYALLNIYEKIEIKKVKRDKGGNDVPNHNAINIAIFFLLFK